MNPKQMIAYVQIYIHIRTGKEVNIVINNIGDYVLLNQAYNIATQWLNENNAKITRIN